jgi:nucleotide-binding universal stress UspA family protein
MFSTVIVGVDGFQGGQDAIALARTLAPAAELVLARAYPYDSTVSRFALLGYGDALREQTEQDVQHTRADAGLPDARIELLADPSPAHALHELAAKRSADLLVVGSSRHGAWDRVFMGDVLRAVLHGSPCPVAIAPKGFASRPVGTIGVAFSDTPEAHEAVSFAAALASALGARLRLRTAVEDPLVMMAPGAYLPDYQEIRASLRTYAQKALGAIVATLDPAIETDAEAIVGRTSDVLDALSAEVDLVICGSRGWGAIRRVALGSTSDRLIHHARCPVVVVPRSASPAPEATTPAVLVHGGG